MSYVQLNVVIFEISDVQLNLVFFESDAQLNFEIWSRTSSQLRGFGKGFTSVIYWSSVRQ